jgi:hypothetical protein
MPPDGELVIIFASLHVVALILGALLFAMFLRSGPDRASDGADEEEEGGGGGGNDRIGDSPPRTSPSGGLPLPDAEPSPIRLRGHGRLADLRATRQRRPLVHPRPLRPRVPSR